MGSMRERLVDTGIWLWVDARVGIPFSVILFAIPSYRGTIQIANGVQINFPQLSDKLPAEELPNEWVGVQKG